MIFPDDLSDEERADLCELFAKHPRLAALIFELIGRGIDVRHELEQGILAYIKGMEDAQDAYLRRQWLRPPKRGEA